MAIDSKTLNAFVKVLSLAVEPGRIKRSEAKTWWSEFRKHKPLDVATIGYPDCLFSRDQAEGILGDGFCDNLPTRDDSEAILRWHNLHKQLDEIYETKAFLNKLNINLTVFDLKEVRGGEVIHNFNLPVLKRQHQTYDMIYDGGTLEHIFNVPEALRNMVMLCKVDGYIIHNNPLSVFNHGFYNFNPTFYHDFYSQNGHEIIGDMEAIKKQGLGYSNYILPTTKKFVINGDNWIFVVAKKKNSKKPEWPIQTKYIENPDLKQK